jgi:hypothetical protein
MIVWVHSYITLGVYETFAAYTLPNGWSVRGHSSSPLTDEHRQTLGFTSVKTAKADNWPGVSEKSIFISSGDTAINNVYVDGCLTLLLA